MGEVVIVLGADREGVERHFLAVEEVGVVDCGYCMPYENNNPVHVARGLRRPVADFWNDIKHYD